MKLKYLFIIPLSLLLFPLSGQTFNGGITGGLNLCQIDGDGDEGYGKLALNAGAFISREIIPDLLYWQLELRYSGRGKYQGPTQKNMSIEIIDLKYLEMPLSLHGSYNDRIQVEFGFAPDVLLRAYYADENGMINPEYADDLRRFGLTAFAGIYYYPLQKLGIGVRYYYSVFPFYKFDAYAVRYRDSGFFHDILSLNVKWYIQR